MIGITFGAFDPLHYGHIKLIKRAKDRCDQLVVCVSTDDYIKTIKKRTSFMNEKKRAEMVFSIKYVDTVDFQTVKGKKPLIKKYKPDVIFVGDDWNRKTFSGEGLGVPVVYLKHTKKINSTKIREIINV